MKHRIILGLALTWTPVALWAQADSQSNQPAESQVESPAEPPTSAAVIDTDPVAPETLAELTQPAADATQVKVIVQKHQTIEEYRQRGELVLVKVIPNEGVPYFIDPLERERHQGAAKDLINSGVKPVRWVLKEF